MISYVKIYKTNFKFSRILWIITKNFLKNRPLNYCIAISTVVCRPIIIKNCSGFGNTLAYLYAVSSILEILEWENIVWLTTNCQKLRLLKQTSLDVYKNMWRTKFHFTSSNLRGYQHRTTHRDDENDVGVACRH